MEGKGGASGQPMPPPLRQRREGDTPRLLPPGKQVERRDLNRKRGSCRPSFPTNACSGLVSGPARPGAGPSGIPRPEAAPGGREEGCAVRCPLPPGPGARPAGSARGARRAVLTLERVWGHCVAKARDEGTSGRKPLEETFR